MKKYILFILIILLGTNFLCGGVKLDVKTKFTEKTKLTGVKFGVIYFLKQEGFKIVEVGETFSVWLLNGEEKRANPDKYTIKMTVSIAPPSLFGQKKALISDEVTVTYSFNPKEINVDDTGFYSFLKEKVENIKTKEKIRAFHVGREVAKKITLLVALAQKNRAEKS
ncbi:MAG: hypothetical protein GY757_55820 [bacterium]|nr:hypothetical protein [bacterium]